MRPRFIAGATVVVTLVFSSVAMANARHLIPPSANYVSGHIRLPRQESATLSVPVMKWLRSQGIRYVIPYVPAGFPPVKALSAAQAAAAHTPVGQHPVILQLALISPLTAISPLTPHSIVWAVVLAPKGRPKDAFYVTYVDVRTPRVVGALFHPHSAA